MHFDYNGHIYMLYQKLQSTRIKIMVSETPFGAYDVKNSD